MFSPSSGWVVFWFYFTASFAGLNLATSDYSGFAIQAVCGLFWIWSGTKDDEIEIE